MRNMRDYDDAGEYLRDLSEEYDKRGKNVSVATLNLNLVNYREMEAKRKAGLYRTTPGLEKWTYSRENPKPAKFNRTRVLAEELFDLTCITPEGLVKAWPGIFRCLYKEAHETTRFSQQDWIEGNLEFVVGQDVFERFESDIGERDRPPGAGFMETKYKDLPVRWSPRKAGHHIEIALKSKAHFFRPEDRKLPENKPGPLIGGWDLSARQTDTEMLLWTKFGVRMKTLTMAVGHLLKMAVCPTCGFIVEKGEQYHPHHYRPVKGKAGGELCGKWHWVSTELSMQEIEQNGPAKTIDLIAARVKILQDKAKRYSHDVKAIQKMPFESGMGFLSKSPFLDTMPGRPKPNEVYQLSRSLTDEEMKAVAKANPVALMKPSDIPFSRGSNAFAGPWRMPEKLPTLRNKYNHDLPLSIEAEMEKLRDQAVKELGVPKEFLEGAESAIRAALMYGWGIVSNHPVSRARVMNREDGHKRFR
ncbi:MAG: hypothetical protein V3W28_06055 [Thermoplasmata archaeon]